MPWKFLQALPNPTDAVLLELVLHFIPLDVLSSPYFPFELFLHSSQLLLVSRSKGPLLLLQESIYYGVDPEFVVETNPASLLLVRCCLHRSGQYCPPDIRRCFLTQ